MGRSSKKGANQHNTRHENGIVNPGKRVSNQKSNGHLNGSIDGKAKENNALVPSVPQLNAVTIPNDSLTNGYTTGSKLKINGGPKQLSIRNVVDSASDEPEDIDTTVTKMGEQQHRKIDVAAAKQAAAHENGPFHLALTVLRSCPIGDTLAILIFLLSLPPTFLHLTNAIFAMLTFVPPSGSFTTLPSLTDITSSFSPGAPSFVVLVVIDLIAICIWSITPWPQLQGVLLDCAQATVATTLGGGYNYRSGSSDNIMWMITVVFATHLGRYRKLTLRWLHKTWASKWLPMVDVIDDLPPRPSYALGPDRSWLDTIKIYVAIHILLQGLTRMVRRALNSPRESSTYASRNIDPEANTNSQSQDTESQHNPPSSPSIMKSKSSLQNLRDVRDKISSGKRRKKQANYVRSQQPLWAAIAATKAKIMREYEQSQATKDAMGPDAIGLEELGSAPFVREENRIWITMVCQDKFYFETGPIQRTKSRDSKENSGEVEDDLGIDRFRPFYVRINGANWASVKALETPGGEDVHGKARWVGEVYGLSPANTYRVSFPRCEDGVELHSEVVVTPSSPQTEHGKFL
jgi:ubiquitination network signaling protein AcrB